MDPESFVRGEGGSNCEGFFLVDEGREDPNTTHYKQAIIGPPAKRHLNGVLLVCSPAKFCSTNWRCSRTFRTVLELF